MLYLATVLLFTSVPVELTEAVEGWRAIEAQYREMSGTVVQTTPDAYASGSGVGGRQSTFAISGNKIKVEENVGALASQTAIGMPQRRVVGLNDQYGFILTRSAKNQPWVALRVEPTVTLATRQSAQGDWFQYASLPYAIAEVPLHELVARNGFQLEGLRDVDLRGTPCKSIAFSYRPAPEEAAARAISQFLRGGTIVANPARNWRVEQLLVMMEAGSQRTPCTFEVTYEAGASGPPRVAQIVRTTKSGGSPDIIATLENLRFGSMPESEFRLSAYGLPDGLAGKPAGSWMPILGGAVLGGALLLLAAVYLFERRKPRTV